MSSAVNGNSISPGDVMIQLDHVTREFGETLAVNDVSFHVRAGEVFGFIGAQWRWQNDQHENTFDARYADLR